MGVSASTEPTSDVEGSGIEVSGLVKRLLPDEGSASRHQRFILDLKNGRSLLVTHNVEIAARIPLGLGDRVEHLPGLNVLYHKEILEEVGGWDERFALIGEDEDLSRRLGDQGFKLFS